MPYVVQSLNKEQLCTRQDKVKFFVKNYLTGPRVPSNVFFKEDSTRFELIWMSFEIKQ